MFIITSYPALLLCDKILTTLKCSHSHMCNFITILGALLSKNISVLNNHFSLSLEYSVSMNMHLSRWTCEGTVISFFYKYIYSYKEYITVYPNANIGEIIRKKVGHEWQLFSAHSIISDTTASAPGNI